MANLVYDFLGSSFDELKVYEDRIVIEHPSIARVLARGSSVAAKTIYYSDLTAVEFKKCGWTVGYIKFSVLGDARTDENTVTISYSKENEIAEKMVSYIQKKIKEAKQPKTAAASTSAADEILKLKNLLDMGIITQKEFDIKKKQLLGL